MDEDKGKPEGLDFKTEMVAIKTLSNHPRNYRFHPQDQIEHLIESIREHGFYRNVVIAHDGTILAGHGVVEAVRQMGLKELPVVRLDIGPDDSRALKILVGDNEIEHLGVVDDRALTEILKGIKETDISGLLGTGYDEKMLANLAFVTRPASEIRDFDEAAAWVGLPEYEPADNPLVVTVLFQSGADRERFAGILGLDLTDSKRQSVWWPPREKDDVRSVRFEGKSG